MLKTNSKKAINNLWAYIMEDIDYINAGYNLEVKKDDKKAAAAAIYDIFKIEKLNNPYYQDNKTPTQDIFEDWAQGLPLGGMFDYYYYNKNAVDILGTILEETEEEKARFTEEAAAAQLTHMIFREIIKNK